jgi:DNA end-binding protein Ku
MEGQAVRPIWKGSITFGLITIPIKVFSAVGREDPIHLHLLHEKDGTRIHYDRRCEKGHKVEWDEIVKGYEYEKGKWVQLSDEELDALDLESLRTIDIVTFAPIEQIDPIYFEKTYYLSPDADAVKAYRLVLDALEEQGLVGVCKVALREREHLSALRVMDGTLVLHTMHWPDEIGDAKFDELRKRPRINDRERKMARELIEQLSGDFDPGEFRDEYHRELKKLIRKKIKGEEIVVPEPEPERAEVVDLMDALKASVDATRKGERPRRKAPSSKRGRRRSSKPDEELRSLSKDELSKRARKLEIPGRSNMDKGELIKAIRRSA